MKMLLLSLVSVVGANIHFEPTNFQEGLINIKVNQIREVVLIVEHQNDINMEIFHQVPFQVYSFDFLVSILLKDLNPFSITRSTLFIIIPRFEATTKIDLLTKVVGKSLTRPKCLVISDRFNDQILQIAWRRQFLDFTLLEITQRGSDPMIWHFNPFTKSYSTSEELFPDKLGDLNGHVIKVGILNATRRNTMLENLSKKMNFKFEKSDCNTIRLLKNVTNDDVLRRFCFSDKLTWTVAIDFNVISIVVPHIFDEFESEFIAINFLYCTIIVFGIFSLVMIVSHLLAFDGNYWNFIQIFSIVLGYSVPKVPQRTKERILFATLFIACEFFSYIYLTLLTQRIEEPKLERRFNTINDVVNSKLGIEVQDVVSNFLDDGVMKMLGRYHLSKRGYQACLKEMVIYKNISCVLTKHELETIGSKPFKIVKEALLAFPERFFLEPGSPFVERFDEMLLRMLESGLIDKNEFSRDGAIEEVAYDGNPMESTESIKLMCLVLFIGCFLASIVFLHEKVNFKCQFKCVS